VLSGGYYDSGSYKKELGLSNKRLFVYVLIVVAVQLSIGLAVDSSSECHCGLLS